MVQPMTKLADDPRTNDSDRAAYRPCVGIALFNRQGRVLVGRRRGVPEPYDHAWQMPQGGIDPGESPLAAGLRELYEETNVAAGSVMRLGEIEDWLAYDLPPEIMKRSWRGRYRGQTQRWVALGFRGDDSEIDIAWPGGGACKPEFDAWRWVSLQETPGLVVPFKRHVYELVAAEFAPHAAWRT